MKKIIVLILIVLVIGSASFWLYTKNKKTVTKYAGPVESVSLRLKWLHQAQFAGNYVAAEKGFYADEGLKVDLQPINLTENTIQAVADGKIDFGISGADDVILARAKGIPVKAIAVIYKINPAAVITLQSSGISSPKDLVGKKVGIQTGNPIEYLFDTMMESKGIKLSEIKKVAVGYDASELINGKIDALVGYITNEPDMVKAAGQKPSSILMADFGVNMYADVLFTSDKTITDKPEMVTRFLKATLNGWQYAVENESEAVDETLKYAKDSKKSHEGYMISASLPLIVTGTGNLGWMEAKAWDQAQNVLFEEKLLSKKINLNDVYTMQFLQTIYNSK